MSRYYVEHCNFLVRRLNAGHVLPSSSLSENRKCDRKNAPYTLSSGFHYSAVIYVLAACDPGQEQTHARCNIYFFFSLNQQVSRVTSNDYKEIQMIISF